MKETKKILVVGASGGSGRKTVEALVSQGHQVTALSEKPRRFFQAQ